MYKKILAAIKEMVADEDMGIDLSLWQMETLAEVIALEVEHIQENKTELLERLEDLIDEYKERPS